ncbi:TldD/PmbA family protein [Infirmifilum sp. SLHALR2]
MFEDLAEFLLRRASEEGVSFADVRFEDTTREYIQLVNGRIVTLSISASRGVAVRVIREGSIGFSSTTELTREGLERALISAVKAAQALGKGDKSVAELGVKEGRYTFDSVRKHPSRVAVDEKIDLVKRAYSVAKDSGASSATSRYGAYYGFVEVYSLDGVRVLSERLVTGVSASVVLRENGKTGDGFETFGASQGLEYFTGDKAPEKAAEKAVEMARLSLKARRPPAGEHVVITRPELTGVFAHESFGHLTEADSIFTKTSPLTGRLGEQIASELVTIVDSGFDPRGGYVLPVDDEGTPTQRTVLVERGVLVGYLHSRESAALLGMKPTGNGRAQSFAHDVIVRMRNTFFERGDWKEEEIIRETRHGLLLDKPAGGQVEEDGTFTFNSRIGFIVENGELKEPVRDVVLAGNILEMLKYIDAVADNVEISTSPFGGCGKYGQMVHVGDGGPSLRATRLLVGGER